jgi:hypothetical protein
MMGSGGNSVGPEFTKQFDQRRKDEKNVLFQTFVDELEGILSGVQKRRSSERTFNNSLGKEVKVIDSSDLKVLGLVQSALKFNHVNINLIISLGDYFDIIFVASNISSPFSRKAAGTPASTRSSQTSSKTASPSTRATPSSPRYARLTPAGRTQPTGPALPRLHGQRSLLRRQSQSLQESLLRRHQRGLQSDPQARPRAARQVHRQYAPLTADDIWRKYFESYYKDIIEIERPDRDDVFRKSTKFDRPDYGNIPYEIFSVLSNMHQTQTQSREELERQTEDSSKAVTSQDFWGESSDDKGESNLEVHEPESEQHTNEDDKGDEDDKPKSPIPTELDLVNAERDSLQHQVIETRQDEDLKQEEKHHIVEVDDIPAEPEQSVQDQPEPKQPEPEKPEPATQAADPEPAKSEDTS